MNSRYNCVTLAGLKVHKSILVRFDCRRCSFTHLVCIVEFCYLVFMAFFFDCTAAAVVLLLRLIYAIDTQFLVVVVVTD